jgi:hypothetical protein
MNTGVDEITLSRTVMFVGDYFTMMTTVVLEEKLRYEDESDEDFAVRLATVFLSEYYGFDDLDSKATVSIGVVEEDEDGEW